MVVVWLIFGIVFILMGIFNRQMARLSGFKPMSEVFTTPNFKSSSKITERIGRWITIIFGVSFFVYGLDGANPNGISRKIAFALLGVIGLMILAVFIITIANWKAR